MLRLSGSEEDTPERAEYVDAIISELLRREEEAPTGRLTDVDKAWNEFQTCYNTPEAEPNVAPDMYEIAETNSDFSRNNEKETVTWNTCTLECAIHTAPSSEELRALVYSRYEREGTIVVKKQ